MAQGAYLANLYASANGHQWHNNFAWGSQRNLCQWYGVYCNCTLAQMRECELKIDLSSNGLTGILPDLRENRFVRDNRTYIVSALSVHNNQLSGTIPSTFHTHVALNKTLHIDLSFNQLVGTVPVLSSLSPANEDILLDLRHNKLSGSLQVGNVAVQKFDVKNFLPQSNDGNQFDCPISELETSRPFILW